MTAMSRCQNCDWQGPDEQLGRQIEDTPDLLERVAPGEPMPTGECPECRALCQPFEEDDEETEYTVALEIMVTATGVGHAVDLALEDLRDPEMEWTDFTVVRLSDQRHTEVKR